MRAGCRFLRRLSHHPAERRSRVFCAPHAPGGRRVHPGRERGRLGQHGLSARPPAGVREHDQLLQLRHLAQERGHLLDGRRASARCLSPTSSAAAPASAPSSPPSRTIPQATKASGNGGFQMLVLSPSTLQEAVDMTWQAFELADKYSQPRAAAHGRLHRHDDGARRASRGARRLRRSPPSAPSKTWAATRQEGAAQQHKVMCGPGLDTRMSQEQMNKRDAGALRELEDHRGRV